MKTSQMCRGIWVALAIALAVSCIALPAPLFESPAFASDGNLVAGERIVPMNAETSARFVLAGDETGAGGGSASDFDPATFSVKLFDEDGKGVVPDEDNSLHFSGLFVGSRYTYTAIAEGWRSVKGDFIATDDELAIEIEFTERSKGRFLDDLMVYPNSSGSVTGNYPLTRAEDLDEDFNATVYTVTYSNQQTSNSFYLAAILSDSAPDRSRIKVSAWGLDGKSHSITLPASKPDHIDRKSLGALTFAAGTKRAVYKVEVGTSADVERYAIVVLRDLQLKSLSVKEFGNEDELLEQTFLRSVHEYDVSVPNTVTNLLFNAVPYDGLENADVLVDGKPTEDGKLVLDLGLKPIQSVRVTLSCDDVYDDPDYASLTYTSSGLYVVHVERLLPISVTFSTDPDDCIVCVYDRNGARVSSSDGKGRTFDGVFAHREYSYVVTRYGCIGQKGSFVAEDGLKVHVALDGASTLHPPLTAVEWWNYRNSYENNGLTAATTPDSADSTSLKWQIMVGGDYNSSMSPPLVGDGYLFTAAGKYVYKVDKTTGEVLGVSEELAGDVAYALNAMTYAEGMLFVQVGSGRVQAISATTMESLWVSEEVGGQTLCPITYRSGYIYTGTWNSETKPGEYLCMSVTDEDPARGDEVKRVSWRWSRTGGFYWAGAYVSEDSSYAVFGSDDGSDEGEDTNTAALFSVAPRTGEEIDRIDDIQGDIRTSIVYDHGYIYFATKLGYLYRVQMNADGTFGDVRAIELEGSATAGPVVYNRRAYVGVCGNGGQFDPNGGHCIAIVNTTTEDFSIAYKVPVPGYPQAAALASTAYTGVDYDDDGEADGRVYLYFTYNAYPGGIAMIADEPDRTSGEIVMLWKPDAAQQQYCISPICADSEGTLYYKNDSGYMFAVTANDAYLNGIELAPDTGEAIWDAEYSKGRMRYLIQVDENAKSALLDLDIPAGRQVSVNGKPYTQGMTVKLADGNQATTFDILVSYRGKSRTYQLVCQPRESEATLKELLCSTSNSVKDLEGRLGLSPEFEPGTLKYATEKCADEQKYVNLWAVPTSAYSNVEVIGGTGVSKVNAYTGEQGSGGRVRYAVYFDKEVESAVVDIVVTAGDGTTKQTYQVTLRRRDTYAPKVENAIGHRFSAENAAVLFETNEGGSVAWVLSGPDDPTPAAPPQGSSTQGSGIAAISKGSVRIDLTGIGPDAHVAWIWTTDDNDNVSPTPTRVPIAAWKTFDLVISINPSNATVEISDELGEKLNVTTNKDKRTASLVSGNRYTIKATCENHVEMTERIIADEQQATREISLESKRSSDSHLKGLYVSSSDKWNAERQSVSPRFATGTTRYESVYNGQRTHLYVWPVAADPKSTVTMYAVGGVLGSTVAKDETIAGKVARGHPYWAVYFAKNMFMAQVRVHVVAEDGTATDYFVKLSIRDTTPPVLKKVTASRLTTARASAVFSSTEFGSYFYEVVPKGSAMPTISTSGKGIEMREGTTNVMLTGLASGEYVLYVVGADSEGNVSNMIEIPIPAPKADGTKTNSNDQPNVNSNGHSSSGSNDSGSLSDVPEGSASGSGKVGSQTSQQNTFASSSSTVSATQSSSSSSAGIASHGGFSGSAGTSSSNNVAKSDASASNKTENKDNTNADSKKTSTESQKSGVGSGNSSSPSVDATSSNSDLDTGADPFDIVSTRNAGEPSTIAQVAEAIAELPPWSRPFFVLAGLGLAYMIFWGYSVHKRKRELEESFASGSGINGDPMRFAPGA